MLEIKDQYINTQSAEELYESLVDRFSLNRYRSTCCYDSKLDRNNSFDYKKELNDFFKDQASLEKTKHHLYINSFLRGGYVLGPHRPIISNIPIRSKDGEYISSSKTEKKWTGHRLLLMGPRESEGGDMYFRVKDSEPSESSNSDFEIIEFKHNRLITSDPKEERLMSFIDRADSPMVHINLLTQNE